VSDWVDLTYPLSPEVPHIRGFPVPKLTRIADMPERPLTISRLEIVVHMGTHVDSPRHFFLDGPAMEAVPLERLVGSGVVVRIEKPAYGVIEPADLEHAEVPIEPGDIVAIDTGWSERWGTADWDHHPCLSVDAARWLVDKRVKLVAVDTPTPDLPLDRRPSNFTWPVHRILLACGVLIAEQLANLKTVTGRRVEFLFAPLPIEGSDGSPARVVARQVVSRNAV
jgi:kynurenine formamidase